MRKITIKLPVCDRHRNGYKYPVEVSPNWGHYPYLYSHTVGRIDFINTSTGAIRYIEAAKLCRKN